MVGIFDDYEIQPLDEDGQKTLIKYVFIFGFIFMLMNIAGYLISLLPPDTRTEYQRTYDECVIEKHVNYMIIDDYGFMVDCKAFLDAMLMNGSKIISTPTNEDGKITKYVIELPK